MGPINSSRTIGEKLEKQTNHRWRLARARGQIYIQKRSDFAAVRLVS